MIKQNKTKLQFIFGAVLFLAVSLAACNNDGEKKETVKDAPAVTTTPPVVIKDTIDTMEKMKGGVSPTPQGN